MRSYKSYIIWYRKTPIWNVVTNDQRNAEQLITDYCMSNNMRPTTDEWLMTRVDTVISRETVSEIMNEVGAGNNMIAQQAQGMSPAGITQFNKNQAIPGLLKVKINPKCFP